VLYLRVKTSSAPKKAVFKKALFGSLFKNYSTFSLRPWVSNTILAAFLFLVLKY